MSELLEKYRSFKARRLSLDMTRGKPCPEQLRLSADLARVDPFSAPGDLYDTRNYGCLEGLPAARQLFAEYLDVLPDEILVQGNSSLTLMHDTVVQALLRGLPESKLPWNKFPVRRFLCPVPGYDRHFAICERFGIKMVPIPMQGEGPDMNIVEAMVRSDPDVVGMWCVPKYSNPTGTVYSDSVVDRLANMETAAPDFRIFWDNAYAVHHLGGQPANLKSILQACKHADCSNRVFIFGSTSKITFAGGGVAMIAGSRANINWFREGLQIQTIGPDKLNQLRHVRFLRDMPTILELMTWHAAILKPKFDAVLAVLDRELGGTGIATWTKPRGGYFISVDVPAGCAKKVVELAAQAGVRLTGAGGTFPYRKDPADSNIRIAPSFPSVEELRQATELFCVAVQLARTF